MTDRTSPATDEADELRTWFAERLGWNISDLDKWTLTEIAENMFAHPADRPVSDLPAPEHEFEDPLRGPTASWLDGYVTAAIFEEGKPPLVEVNYLPAPDPDAFAAAIKAAGRYTKAGADD